MYRERQIDGKTYRAYLQEGHLSCGPASVVNAIYFLTGQEVEEAPIRHDTGVQMTTKTIGKTIRKLKFGKQGRALLKKFEAFEESAEFKADPTLRPTMGPENDKHFAFLYNAEELDDCADIADIQKSLKKFGLHSTNGQRFSPWGATTRARTAFSLPGANRCFILGVKWTEDIAEEGGGHWVTVVAKRNNGNLIVLDSEAGVVIAHAPPKYGQGGDGERGFFDGYFIEIWAN